MGASAAAGWFGYQKSIAPVAFEPVSLAEQHAPQSRHVELTAVAQTPLLVEYVEKINGQETTYTYLPLTPPGWRRSDPIAYFLRPNFNVYIGANRTFSIDPNTAPFPIVQKGVLFRDDLPGLVISEYEKHGFRLASSPVVLDTKLDSDTDIYFEIALGAGFFVVTAFAVAAIFAFKTRHLRAGNRARRSAFQ
jgi:hypothetical protein